MLCLTITRITSNKEDEFLLTTCEKEILKIVIANQIHQIEREILRRIEIESKEVLKFLYKSKETFEDALKEIEMCDLNLFYEHWEANTINGKFSPLSEIEKRTLNIHSNWLYRNQIGKSETT